MSTIGIAAASYEGSLFSWKGNCTRDETECVSDGVSETTSTSVQCELGMTSGFHCCAGSIRSLSTSGCGRYLACGGTDERIHIFNMLENSTLGELSAHTGAVTCLDFFEDSYLLSGSDDNSICIWRTHDWMCVHILGGHKGSINCVSIHPSGKLAVSVAQDNTLKVWNLVQGRIAFTRRLKGSANLVKWLKPSGAAYMLVVGKKVEVYATADNSMTTIMQHNSRVNQADFVGTEGKMVSVCEDKALRMFNAKGEMISIVDFSILNTRVRDFSLVTPSRVPGEQGDEEMHAMALATSDGKILLVNLDLMVEHEPVEEVESEGSDEDDESEGKNRIPATPVEDVVISTYEIKAEPRLTCVSAWVQGEKKTSGKKVRKNKSKKASSDVHSDDEDSVTKGKSVSRQITKKKRKDADDDDEETGRKKVRFVAEDSSMVPDTKKKKAVKSSKKKKGNK